MMMNLFIIILLHSSVGANELFNTQQSNDYHGYLQTQPTYNFDRHGYLSTNLLGQISSNITFNPKFEPFLNAFDQDSILKNIQVLSQGHLGEGWVTRHSYSSGALKAIDWLKRQYENLNLQDQSDSNTVIKCELDHYLDGVAPNLICKMSWSFNDAIHRNNTFAEEIHDTLDHATDTIDSPNNRARSQAGEEEEDLIQDGHSIVLTAHYDSKGSFGSIEAPGVDDNASGCAALLAIADLIKKKEKEIIKLKKERKLLQKNSKNKFEVIFIHFSGTEQGLIGSESISKKIRNEITKKDEQNIRKLVLLLINVNMISYRALYEPLQMGLSNLGCSSESLEFMNRISNTYVPELLVGNTSIGLSDEVNFQSIGILNSIRIFESLGHSIKNPNYLRSSDSFSNFLNHHEADSDSMDLKSQGCYDILQVVSIAQVLLASVLELLLS